MISECPKCKKKYRVNDSDIPVGGGQVRCPNCSNIFTIYRKPLDIELIPVEEEKTREPSFEEISTGTSFGEIPTESTMEKAVEAEEKESVTAEPTTTEAKEIFLRTLQEKRTVEPKITAPPLPESWSEEKKKEHQKARRLARSLTKDILLYHQEDVIRGRKEGNLVELLRDEIKRSWKFYKKQVGEDILKEKNHFKDALNEIIAGGEEIFA